MSEERWQFFVRWGQDELDLFQHAMDPSLPEDEVFDVFEALDKINTFYTVLGSDDREAFETIRDMLGPWKDFYPLEVIQGAFEESMIFVSPEPDDYEEKSLAEMKIDEDVIDLRLLMALNPATAATFCQLPADRDLYRKLLSILMRFNVLAPSILQEKEGMSNPRWVELSKDRMVALLRRQWFDTRFSLSTEGELISWRVPVVDVCASFQQSPRILFEFWLDLIEPFLSEIHVLALSFLRTGKVLSSEMDELPLVVVPTGQEGQVRGGIKPIFIEDERGEKIAVWVRPIYKGSLGANDAFSQALHMADLHRWRASKGDAQWEIIKHFFSWTHWYLKDVVSLREIEALARLEFCQRRLFERLGVPFSTLMEAVL